MRSKSDRGDEYAGYMEHDIPPGFATQLMCTYSRVDEVLSGSHTDGVHTFSELIYAAPPGRFTRWTLVLDSGSTISVIREESLLTNIRRSSTPIRARGIKGTVIISQVGDLKYFGTVYFCPEMPANILSFDEVAENFRVTFEQDPRRFDVYFGKGNKLCFTSTNRLYLANLGDIDGGAEVFPLTVSERESEFTKREVEAARMALRVHERLGFPSDIDIDRLFKSGSLINCPVTFSDVLRARAIYGPSLAALKGKTVAKAPIAVRPEYVPRFDLQGQTLLVDLMFVEGEPYLISLTQPLGYTMCSYLFHSRGITVVRKALFEHIAAYKSKHYRIIHLLTDREGAVMKLKSELNSKGIAVNPTGAGQHVHAVERKIRTIKERVRAHLNVLPFKLPRFLLMFLVLFCVFTLNMLPSNLRADPISPRETMRGIKTDFKRDLRVSFGEYVQVHEPSDPRSRNSMAQRTRGCIALNPVDNLQGTVRFWSIANRSVITRDHWTPLPMPAEVISAINSISNNENNGVSEDPEFGMSATLRPIGEEDRRMDDIVSAEQLVPRAEDGQNPTENSEGEEETTTRELPTAGPRATHDLPTDTPHTPDVHAESEDTVHVEPGNTTSDTDDPPESPPSDEEVESRGAEGPEGINPEDEPQHPPLSPPRYTFRPNRSRGWIDGKWQDVAFFVDYFCFHNVSVKQALQKFPYKAIKSIYSELKQMEDMEVWEVQNPKHLTKSRMKSAIRSSMFLREKFTPDGKFEKLKSRLVAGGHMQDRTIYEDISSPTVSTSSAFMIAAIAASESREVATVDIKGAYLNAKMKGHEILMKLDPTLSKFLVEMYPDKYTGMTDDRGNLTVKLKKALYGCIESAKLWFETLQNFLLELGFSQNPHDICVFNKDFNGQQCTICVHVDDLMITCKTKSVVDEVCNSLRAKFTTINENRGKIHPYLGMIFDFSSGHDVSITMSGYVNDVLKEYEVTKTAKTPAANDLYDIRDSPKLPSQKSDDFHSRVAKLLYLAKRVRPDILQPVIFLTSRVRESTLDDWDKLDRILRYITPPERLGSDFTQVNLES